MEPETRALSFAALLLIIVGTSGLAYWTLTNHTPEPTGYDYIGFGSGLLLFLGVLITFGLFWTRFDKWAREHGGISGSM